MSDALTLRPRVRWGRATAFHLGVGGIAGLVGPFVIFAGADFGDGGFDSLWVVVYLAIVVSGALIVVAFGAGVPVLIAWLTWVAASRRHRTQTKEVLAVVLGALAGALLPSAGFTLFFLLFRFFSQFESPLQGYLVIELILGGPAALAFALRVAGAWRRARRHPELSLN